MPGSHNLKAQEAESPEQGSSVIPVLGETDEDVLDLQLLLGKLQQHREAVLAPLGQRSPWDLDVEAASAQHCSPVDGPGLGEAGLDMENPRLAVARWLLGHIQPIIRVQ